LPRSFNEAEAHAPRMPFVDRQLAFSAYCFNEAEAHAPRMPPPYNPLVVKAISAGFRARLPHRQNLPDLTCIHIDHVKQPYESNKLRRFERVRYSARHRAPRKRPASMKKPRIRNVLASARPSMVLYDDGSALNLGEILADALHGQFDLVGRPDID
jgi:hypothetical protein